MIEIRLKNGGPELGIVILGRNWEGVFVTTQGLMTLKSLEDDWEWRRMGSKNWNSCKMSDDQFRVFILYAEEHERT